MKKRVLVAIVGLVGTVTLCVVGVWLIAFYPWMRASDVRIGMSVSEVERMMGMPAASYKDLGEMSESSGHPMSYEWLSSPGPRGETPGSVGWFLSEFGRTPVHAKDLPWQDGTAQFFEMNFGVTAFLVFVKDDRVVSCFVGGE